MIVEMQLNCTGGWTDYSDEVDVSSLKLSKSLDSNKDPQKNQSSTIEVFGSAYTFVMTNLYTGSNRYSNSICVRITDVLCSSTEYLFKIDNRDIKWCDNSICKLECDLVQYNAVLDCIRRTTIADNYNNEFQDYPVSGNPHPRFRYCDVVKPTFMYGMLVTISNALVLLINSLNVVIASITGIIVWIVNILGGSWSVPSIGVGFAEDLLGCSRGFPAPFIRTYVQNVCDKCGVYVDDLQAPTFFATSYSEDGGATSYENDYYYLCLLTAYTTKGVDMDGGKDYITLNQPSWTLDALLSKVKPFFNARWYLSSDDNLFFERKDRIGELIWGSGNAIDLSGDDATNLLGDVCYKWNGKGKPQRIFYSYGIDASDNIGNELRKRFNGEYLDTSGNPNYNESIEENQIEFGAVACILDGQDSAYDENVANALAGAVSGTDYEGCIKTQGDTLALAKLVVWDSLTDIEDARISGVSYDIYGSVGADIKAFQNDDANFILVTSGDCSNYNFQMSFDPDADDIAGGGTGFRNLWRFHSIDANNDSDLTNVGFEFTLQFCCAYNTLDLYQKVLFKDGVTRGEIDSVDFDFGKREIIIKGNLIN